MSEDDATFLKDHEKLIHSCISDVLLSNLTYIGKRKKIQIKIDNSFTPEYFDKIIAKAEFVVITLSWNNNYLVSTSIFFDSCELSKQLGLFNLEEVCSVFGEILNQSIGQINSDTNFANSIGCLEQIPPDISYGRGFVPLSSGIKNNIRIKNDVFGDLYVDYAFVFKKF